MPRGGKRLGAGSKPKWKHGKTKTIRVPEALADEILEIVRKLDSGASVSLAEELGVIDLSELAIPQIRNKRFVFLQDLIRLGYEIKPLNLAQSVRKEMKLTGKG